MWWWWWWWWWWWCEDISQLLPKIWLMKMSLVFVLDFILFFRYDEWIKADKIVRPANKNVPKIKHRKKIKVRVWNMVILTFKIWSDIKKRITDCIEILTEQSWEGARQVGEAQWQRRPRPFTQLEPRPALQMWPESGCLFQDGRGWGQRDSAVSSQVYRNYFYPQWPAR